MARRKDLLSKEQRHTCMSHIRSTDTGIEVALRKALWAKGYHYRKNARDLPGSPDIVLTGPKIAIFCDGELFHGKNWEVTKPRLLSGSNPDYWVKKIERNMRRDRENDKELLFLGWTVILFWGLDILSDPGACVKVIEEAIFDDLMDQD